MRERCNGLLARVPQDVLVVALMLLASSGAFGLGMLAGKGSVSASGKDGFLVEELATTSTASLPAAAGVAPVPEVASAPAAPLPTNTSSATIAPAAGTYVASKSGAKYYLPTCSGAARIKDENKIWFATAAAAAAAGYTPAANCKGL